MQYDVKVLTHSTSASIDSESIYGNCAIECMAVLSQEKTERILSAMTLKEDEAFERCGSKITVYYPTPSDTLFSVAKKYHTSCVKLASDNSITESVLASDNPDGRLSGVKKLLIY